MNSSLGIDNWLGTNHFSFLVYVHESSLRFTLHVGQPT